jgi:trans-L-3-hydroxyproline dehydratase
MAPQSYWLSTTDYHTAGEPFRIVKDLPPDHLTPNLTVSQQRLVILSTPSHPLDLLRRTLCHEPRGHADMYGCFITPPDDPGAHFGVLFWHKNGFSTACGHGTIALGEWAVTNRVVERAEGEGEVDVVVDVPSGRVVARVGVDGDGVVRCVDFVNVASWMISAGIELSVSLGAKQVPLTVDLSFGGAVYACVDAAALGLRVEPANYHTFVELGRKIKAEFPGFLYKDKYDLYGVCFFEHISQTPRTITQRNVVVFADGQIDRSPCGSGTCARLAVLLAKGEVSVDRHLIHESILGTQFEAFVMATMEAGEGEGEGGVRFPACMPRVRGRANLVGKMEFFIDPGDPVYPGFVFR